MADDGDAQEWMATELRDHCLEAHAFAFRRYAAAVRASSRRVLSHEGQVDDVVLRVFEDLWENPDRFDPERGSLATYLRVQARGRSIDLVRAESRRTRHERSVHLNAHHPSHVQDPSSHVVVTYATGELRKYLALLPESERLIIELSFFGGKSYRAVATQLGLPEGTVKSRIRRGLSRLRVIAMKGGIRPGSLDSAGAA